MKKYILPNIYDHKGIHSYLEEFLVKNKDRRGFSQRSLSKKLSWPVSYLPALLKRKKSFTVNRAIQFSRFYGLGIFDMEKMIYFAIVDSKLALEKDVERITQAKTAKWHDTAADADLLNAHAYLVFETILILRNQANAKNISLLLKRRRVSEKEVKDIIYLLEKKKIISIKNHIIKPLVQSFSGDGLGPNMESAMWQYHMDLCDLQKEFFRGAGGSGTFIGGFCILDKRRVDEIGDKLFAFRNWLSQVAAEDAKKSLSEGADLYHFDLNLTSVFDKKDVRKLIDSKK